MTTPTSMFSAKLIVPAIGDAFGKLDPRALIRNPVLFTTAVVALLLSVLLAVGGEPLPLGFQLQLIAWLWLTVLFGTFAEALAEGRGRAQAASLRAAKSELTARLPDGRTVAAAQLILRAAQPIIRALHKADGEAGLRNVRKVVNISSMAGLFGNAGQINYSAGKAGITGMTMTLAKEWGRMDVTVNCIAFGFIKTRLTGSTLEQSTANIAGREIKVGVNTDLMEMLERTIPLGRGGTPDEAAGAVYLFCIPESDYVSGQTLMCSGGLTGM